MDNRGCVNTLIKGLLLLLYNLAAVSHSGSLGVGSVFSFLIFVFILIALKQKKSSVINCRTCSTIQYDLNFNHLFNCSVYNEAHLPNNRTWRESFASSQFWWLFPLEQAAAKRWFCSGLIWNSKFCIKHRLKHANLTAGPAQCSLKPHMRSAVLLLSHQCTWLSHSPTNEAPSLILSHSWPWFRELV